MTTAQLRRLIESYGGSLEESHVRTRSYTVSAIIEGGQRWAGNSLHEYVEACNDGPASWRSETRDALAEDVRYGVEPCDDPECEWCHPAEGE